MNDLEKRGLVLRRQHDTNSRVKIVSLADAGHDLLERSYEVEEPAPKAFRILSNADLREFARILDVLASTSQNVVPHKVHVT